MLMKSARDVCLARFSARFRCCRVSCWCNSLMVLRRWRLGREKAEVMMPLSVRISCGLVILSYRHGVRRTNEDITLGGGTKERGGKSNNFSP